MSCSPDKHTRCTPCSRQFISKKKVFGSSLTMQATNFLQASSFEPLSVQQIKQWRNDCAWSAICLSCDQQEEMTLHE